MKLRTLVYSVASLSLLVLGDTFAHDTTDWRTDRAAFHSARREARPAKIMTDSDYPNIALDADFFTQKLAQLSGAADVVIDGEKKRIVERARPANLDLARKFLTQEYTSIGFEVSTHTFPTGINLIAERKGSDPSKVLIVSAHLDSVGNAGSNDDGVGTIAALTLSRALKGYDLRYTLRILAFDQEEVGLVGSRAYARSLSKVKDSIIGDIQMEMMATNARKDGRFHVIDCDKADSMRLTDHIMGAAAALKLPLTRSAACTDRSDHSSFWDAGIPAVVLSENFFGGDSDPCYHDECDVFDSRLDLGYALNISRAIASAVGRIVEASVKKK